MKIVRAKTSEYQKVVHYYHEVILNMTIYPFHPPWTIGIYPDDDYLKQLVDDGEMFIGIEGDEIVGAMVLNNKSGDGYDKVAFKVLANNDEVTVIHLLCVLPAYWRRGYGKELLDYAYTYAKTNNQKALRLDVTEKNLKARKLYIDNGFEEIDTIKINYESTGWTSFVIYEKELR